MPRRISALLRVRIASIACGPYHSAAIDTHGRLFSWGWALEAPDVWAVAGTQPKEMYVASPCRLPEWRGPSELAAFVGVACGCYATAAWDAAERLYTWGDGSSGQLGLAGCASVATPKRVEAGSAVVGAAFGGASSHSGFLLVRTRDGLLSCGDPVDGKLGRPSSVDGKGDGVPHSQLGAVEFGTGGGWFDLACQ